MLAFPVNRRHHRPVVGGTTGEDGGVWFADLVLDVGRGYFPLVRFALARFQPISGPGSEIDRTWQGTLSLPNPLPSPLRVTILEAELYLTDGQRWQDVVNIMGQQDVLGLTPTATTGAQQNVGYRVTFADAIVVP